MKAFNKLTFLIAGIVPATTILVLQAYRQGTLLLSGADQLQAMKAVVLAGVLAGVLDALILGIPKLQNEPLIQTLLRLGAGVGCAAWAFHVLS